MFTGLIGSVAPIKSLNKSTGACELSIDSEFVSRNVAIGDSVAIDGACLTVKEIVGREVRFDVSSETIKRTIIDSYQKNTEVNCELSILPSGRMGGHIVLGHIDTIGTVSQIYKDNEYSRIRIEFDRIFAPLVVEKGSIAINGVSLTINEIGDNFAVVMIIPHTLEHTNLKYLKGLSRVNIEFDILGKYIYRMMSRSSFKDSRLKRLLEEGEI